MSESERIKTEEGLLKLEAQIKAADMVGHCPRLQPDAADSLERGHAAGSH